MTPEMALLILQFALKYGPAAGKAIKDLFTKEDPTDADWQKVWDLMEEPWKEAVVPPPPVVP